MSSVCRTAGRDTSSCGRSTALTLWGLVGQRHDRAKPGVQALVARLASAEQA
jgi:hypothetical protein